MNRRGANLTGPLGGAMVARWGASSLIQSVQYGTINMNGVGSATATIAEVKTENSLIFHLMGDYDANSSYIGCLTHVTLTNGTTVTGTTSNAFGAARAEGFCVIEFKPGVLKNVQRGTITFNAAMSGTATITEVNTSKTFLNETGWFPSTAGPLDLKVGAPRLALTNATTITSASKQIPGYNVVVAYQAAEFF